VLIPSNLYGPNDHYGSVGSHLVAAALYKAHVAKRDGADHIDVWGDGTARREFTFVEDVSDWVATAAGDLSAWPPMMNIGLGTDHSILDYYRYALNVVGYDCELRLDPSKPAGMHQKLMDSSLAAGFGWTAPTDAESGMRAAYAAYLAQQTEH
jgi:GDP-L-fucose synthase